MAELKNGEKKKKHFLYYFFNPKGSGKGITKEEAKKMKKNIPNFFKFFFGNFNTMFALNALAIFGNFPILFGLYALTGSLNVNTFTPASSMFAPFYGAYTAGGTLNNPVSAAFFGVHGVQASASLPTAATYTFFALTLLMFFTFGLVNVATTFVMRNIVKGDPSMFFSDIKYSIKKNFKQGMIMGFIDLLFICVLAYDLLIFYIGANASTVGSFLFGMTAVIAAIYAMMRTYFYIMLVTFDLSIYKIIKNSFIFALLGFKRNIAALIGTVLVLILDFMVMTVMMPLGVVFPVIFLISMVNFMGVYAAYPKVKEVMIDPYYVSDSVGAKKHSEVTEDDDREEPIFKDRG